MEKTTSQNLMLGMFVIIGTVLMLMAFYLVGNRQTVFGNALKISTTFKNVNGLNNGNKVRFSGITVGKVSDIEMINDTSIRVHLVIEGSMKHHIRKDAVAAIGTDGLVGSMIVNIIPGEGTMPMVNSGDQIRSYSRIAAEDLISTLNVTNENAALLTADLLMITRSLLEGKGTLGKLLTDTSMATDLHLTISNLKIATNQANATIKDLNDMVGSVNFDGSLAGVLFSDTLSAGKVRSIISQLEVSGNEIAETTQNLNALIEEIRMGKGPVNYLANDSDFVHSLQSTMQNIDEGTESFKENMEALKHNVLFRGYFKRKDQKANRAIKKSKE